MNTILVDISDTGNPATLVFGGSGKVYVTQHHPKDPISFAGELYLTVTEARKLAKALFAVARRQENRDESLHQEA
jgi:hypothetical protein